MEGVKFSLYNFDHKDSESHRRTIAVEAALQVIACYGLAGNNTSYLETHMANLSMYADKIQQAIKGGEA